MANLESELLDMRKTSKSVNQRPEHNSIFSAVDKGCSKKTSPARKRILLMEEEPSIRNLIERMLTPKGFEVVCAKDGDEAVKLYQDAMTSTPPFDVVILDLTVTFGMGGTETIKHLIEIDPDVKGIVASGYPFDDVILNYSKYGFKGAITKPFSMSELTAILIETIQNG